MTASAWCRRLLIVIVISAMASAVKYPLTFTPDLLHALITIQFGSPAQNLDLIIDVGSSDLVLFQDKSICNSHCYNATTSSTFAARPDLPVFNRTAVFHFDVDGAVVGSSMPIVIGTDTFAFDHRFNTSLAFILVSQVEIRRRSVPARFPTFHGADGVLGMAYAYWRHLACLDSIDQDCTQFRRAARLQQPSSMVILEFGANQPALTIGNISDEYRPLIRWGSSNPYSAPQYHRFTLYDLSLCGAHLLANYTLQWEAMIDTAASCLSLPADFFDMVMAWIPSVRCDSEPLPCWVPANATSTLPKLTFNLGPGQDLLYLPLEQLLIPGQNGSSRLCIYRDQHLSLGDRLTGPAIVLGTLPMKAFYTVLDFDSVRVGLANRLSLNRTTSEVCSSVVHCIGQQRRWIPMNQCLDPDCTGYLVRFFDPQTKTCALYVQSEIVVYVMVGALFFAELALHAVYWVQCRKITAAVPSF